MKLNKEIDLKKDGIFQLFIKIAVPSSIGTIFQNLYTIVDSIYAGKMISKNALAAIGQVFPIYFVIIAIGVGLSIGTTSLIANYLGENNKNKAANVLAQSLSLCIFISIIITFLGLNLSEFIIYSINNDLKTLDLSLSYMKVIYFGSIFIFILMSLNSSLSAQGDTKSYRNVLFFSFLLNIILNPILITGKIYNLQIFSPLGISGIAIATILSQFIGVLYLYKKVLKTKIYIYFKYFYLIPNFQTIKNILSQGIPAAIGMLMIAIGSYIILFFVSKFGTDAIAGYSAAVRYEGLLFLPLLGLNTAVITIVGQNYGAKQFDRIIETYKKGLLLGVIILSILAFIIYLTSEISIKLFTSDKEVIFYGSIYLKISAIMFPAYPFFFIGNALFQGLKKAIIVMYMGIFRFLIIPLIIILIIFYSIEENYSYMFYGILLMHWIIALFYFIFTKNKLKNIRN